MSQTRTCPECGAALPADAPGGLCPRCLWDVGAAQTATVPMPRVVGQLGNEGRRFGNYELLAEIGRGGMGVVYKARQRNLGRVVAVKMVRGEHLAQGEEAQRFRREAALAATLQHPHIVAVHEAGEVEGQYFYSMDYVEGRSLEELVREHPLPARQVAQYTKAVAEAVAYAHQRGILHRDLKPSNVLIGPRDEPRVVDFGLAKALAESGPSALKPQLTQTGQVLGSPSYMAPEQAAGRQRGIDERTDLYAIGAILYELLSGRPPFKAETPLATLKLVLETEPVSPRLLNPRLPKDLETICLKCLEKDPARRYASAQMVADDLARFLEAKPIVARPVGAPEKVWRWCLRKPLATSLAGGLMAACLWNLSSTPLTPVLGGLGLGLAFGGWFWWRARLSSRLLQRERVQRAIDAALTAVWGADRAATEQAIRQAERDGAPEAWMRMLQGQIALQTLRVDEAVGQFEAAVSLDPRNVAAKAMLATAYFYSGELERYGEMLGMLDRLSPQTPEDFLFLGAAFVAGHPDTSKAVLLLEQAKQKRPSGITFLQLALAEGFHAADLGSWPTARKAMEHCEWASEILGHSYPLVLTVRLNGCNIALRLCPQVEKTAVLERATEAALALESTQNPIGCIQRACYFETLGDEDAALKEWWQAVHLGGRGLFASYYAAAMLGRGRSAEALEIVGRMEQSKEALTAVSRACLLLDQKRSGEAEQAYRQVVAHARSQRLLTETIPLLAGQPGRVAATCARLLDMIPAQHPDYPILRFLAGQCTAQELVDDAIASRNVRCTAHHWVALRFLAQGDRNAARAHFAQSIEIGTQLSPVFQWSRAFLARLAERRWPSWIDAC